MTKPGICPICHKSWDRCKCDLEKDFGVKIGSKEEAKWKLRLERLDASIEESQVSIEFNNILRPHILKKIEEEREKFKKSQ